MSDYLAAAAAAMGGPEELVMRSARARAEAAGVSVDDILQAWAGGEAAPAGTAPPPPAEPAEAAAPEPTEEATPDTEPAPADEPAVAAAPAAATGTGEPRMVQGPPPPETVSATEAAEWDVVTTVPSVGLKERTNAVVPGWLMAFFVVIPILAVGYITTGSSGPECGEAGQLAVNFRNELVNCDLSAYEGAGGPGGGGATNFVALGGEVYAANCASCHMANGAGGAAGPQLSGGAVVSTFSACSDHQTWVALGTAGWSAEIGATYGDTNKPTGGFGNMPGFGSLTEEQIATVALYERVVFGGANADDALVDCGLVAAEDGEAPAEDGEAPADGEEAPAEGEEAPAEEMSAPADNG